MVIGPRKRRVSSGVVRSQLVNGMSDAKKRKRIFKNISEADKIHPIGAVFIQEHHIKAADAATARADADRKGLLLMIAPLPASFHKGGTAIIIPHSAIHIPKGSSLHAETAKLQKTTPSHMTEGYLPSAPP